MEEQKALTSSSKKTKSSKLPDWVKNLSGAVIVGLVVLAGQIFINPIVAKRVKTQESITEKRYEVCESAVNLLQRRLASAKITGKSVPDGYTPPEKYPPTQLEINVTYTLLTIYCKSRTIADEFFAATGPKKINPADIIKFVSAVRKELVDKGSTVDKIQYRFLSPVGENGQKDEEAKDEQTQ